MLIITEVRTYLDGLLNSTGREPVEVENDTVLDDPTEPLRWLKLPAKPDGIQQEIKIGSGVVQRL